MPLILTEELAGQNSLGLIEVLVLVYELGNIARNSDKEIAALDDNMLVELGCAVNNFLSVGFDELILLVEHLFIPAFLGINVQLYQLAIQHRNHVVQGDQAKLVVWIRTLMKLES